MNGNEPDDLQEPQFENEPTAIVAYDPGLLQRMEITRTASIRAIEICDDMVKAAIRMTGRQHWYNHSDKPYPKESGVNLIKRALPVELEMFFDPKTQRSLFCDDFEDANGPYYIYNCTVKASWTNGLFGSQTATGTASSRDPLFGRKAGAIIPLCEIDRQKVMKKAGTNGRRNALMRLLGIQDITWEIFETLTGLKKGDLETIDMGGATQDKSRDDDSETSEKRNKMRDMIVEMMAGDNMKAQDYLEKITTWQKKGGEPVKGRRQISQLSAKQIMINYKKVEKDFLAYLAAQDSAATEQDKEAPEW
ncbi:MAG: hypothetical protein GY847_01485 [Proteobacteria bacterium]|nr:hypothetical protein [Pseudomonadota bacterium]